MHSQIGTWALASLGWLLASQAAASGDPGNGTADRRAREFLRHLRNQQRLAAAGASTAASQSADVGDVAVIVDNGRIFIPPRPENPFDLPVPSGLRFAPSGTDGFAVSATQTPLDPAFGASLGLGDDAAAPVEAADSGMFNGGAGFPFLGTSTPTNAIFVGSDGHVTLGAPDAASTARDAERHVGGPPRVSPLFVDLDPSAAGNVRADVRSDRIVITWDGLPEFGADPAASSNTFQVVLWASGAIDVSYAQVDARFAVVGVAEGSGEGPIHEIDLTADLPVTLQAGAIFEEFAPAVVVQQMDVFALAKEFYRAHGDVYDFLVVFTEDVVDLGGAFAYHVGLHSDTEGLGFYHSGTASTRFDLCEFVELPTGCELESLVNMNRIGLYWPDEVKLVDPPLRSSLIYCLDLSGRIVPCAALSTGMPAFRRARWMGTLEGDFGAHGSYTLGLNSAMSIMGQEAGHRWLAFPAIDHPVTGLGADHADLLGRALAHWSWFFNVRVPEGSFGGDPRASSAEGNAIEDLGPNAACLNPGERLFLTARDELIDGYTELDQYFLGVRLPGEVRPFWYVDAPTRPGSGVPFPAEQAQLPAQDDRFMCGRRVDLTLRNITDVGDVIIPSLDSNGTRDPLIGDEEDAGPGIGAADDATCASERRCVDVKTMAFILLVASGEPGSPSHAAAIQHVDTFRRTWQRYANGSALGGRGARGTVGSPDYIPKFDTSLRPAIH